MYVVSILIATVCNQNLERQHTRSCINHCRGLLSLTTNGLCKLPTKNLNWDVVSILIAMASETETSLSPIRVRNAQASDEIS